VAWAGFAAALPVLVRGHRLAVDVMGAALWAAGLGVVVTAVARVGGAGSAPRGALLGAAAAAVIAVACAEARRRHSADGGGPQAVP
jgi:hypothetical protein